jgi:hypothetical protein
MFILFPDQSPFSRYPYRFASHTCKYHLSQNLNATASSIVFSIVEIEITIIQATGEPYCDKRQSDLFIVTLAARLQRPDGSKLHTVTQNMPVFPTRD